MPFRTKGRLSELVILTERKAVAALIVPPEPEIVSAESVAAPPVIQVPPPPAVPVPVAPSSVNDVFAMTLPITNVPFAFGSAAPVIVTTRPFDKPVVLDVLTTIGDVPAPLVFVIEPVKKLLLLIMGSTETVGEETVCPCPSPPTVTPTALVIKPASLMINSGSGPDMMTMSPFQMISRLALLLPERSPLLPPDPFCQAYSLAVRA